MTDARAHGPPTFLAGSLAAHALVALVALGAARRMPHARVAAVMVAFDAVALARPDAPRTPEAHPPPRAIAPPAARPQRAAHPAAAPAHAPVVAPIAAPANAPSAAPAGPAVMTAGQGAEPLASGPSASHDGPVGPRVEAPAASAHAAVDEGPGLDVGAYLSGLTARVRRYRAYPAIAQEMGLEGVVTVRIVVQPDGTLAAPPALDAPCGHEVLDEEALRIVARAAPFAPLQGHRGPLTLRVPVRFHLEE